MMSLKSGSYPVFTSKKIPLSFWSSGSSKTVIIDPLEWNTLTSATLSCTVTSSTFAWPSWATLHVNGKPAQDFDFRLGSGAIPIEVDAMDLIKQGRNVFIFDITKIMFVGFGEYTVEITLVLEGEFTDPPPPQEEIPWWVWATVGMVIVGVVASAWIVTKGKRGNGNRSHDIETRKVNGKYEMVRT